MTAVFKYQNGKFGISNVYIFLKKEIRFIPIDPNNILKKTLTSGCCSYMDT
jgi:hypothetical protein